MKKRERPKPPETKAIPPFDPETIGISGCYRIKRFSLYGYQAYRVNPSTGEEKSVGINTTFGSVASTLIDIILKDIDTGAR